MPTGVPQDLGRRLRWRRGVLRSGRFAVALLLSSLFVRFPRFTARPGLMSFQHRRIPRSRKRSADPVNEQTVSP
jgi:hypothetical protein